MRRNGHCLIPNASKCRSVRPKCIKMATFSSIMRQNGDLFVQNALYLGRFEVEKVRCLIKHALCLYPKMCFSLQRGTHFHKNHENMSPQNGKCCPNHVRYIKISPQWGRMHQDVIRIMSDTSLKSAKEATCSNNTHICEVFWGAACGARGGWKGKRPNDRAMGPKNMTNTGSI